MADIADPNVPELELANPIDDEEQLARAGQELIRGFFTFQSRKNSLNTSNGSLSKSNDSQKGKRNSMRRSASVVIIEKNNKEEEHKTPELIRSQSVTFPVFPAKSPPLVKAAKCVTASHRKKDDNLDGSGRQVYEILRMSRTSAIHLGTAGLKRNDKQYCKGLTRHGTQCLNKSISAKGFCGKCYDAHTAKKKAGKTKFRQLAKKLISNLQLQPPQTPKRREEEYGMHEGQWSKEWTPAWPATPVPSEAQDIPPQEKTVAEQAAASPSKIRSSDDLDHQHDHDGEHGFFDADDTRCQATTKKGVRCKSKAATQERVCLKCGDDPAPHRAHSASSLLFPSMTHSSHGHKRIAMAWPSHWPGNFDSAQEKTKGAHEKIKGPHRVTRTVSASMT
eukprot:gb/GEZN01010436.1/.p1 GENE.gb/GEZN01010436.1/~~gb/GEZN01010436.1/.p1  ORF type:complete len:391 (+),score=51.02 gb/GEZN01010436.1/:3-1175(+)